MYETALTSNSYNSAGIPAIHGGGDGSDGGLLMLLDSMLNEVARFFEPGNSIELLPGISALALNQHPLLVHFPITFLFTFFLFELVGAVWSRPAFREAASWALYLGAVTAILAAVAGLIAEDIVPHGEDVHEIMEWHKRLGLTVSALALILAIWRLLAKSRFSPMARALHLGLAAVMATCLVFGADLGAVMVYQYGVGVKPMEHVDRHHHHHGGDGASTAAPGNIEQSRHFKRTGKVAEPSSTAS